MQAGFIDCQTLIYGASALGLGLASGLHTIDDVLIVEPGSRVTGEFVSALRPGTDWHTPLHHPQAKVWLEKLQDTNLLSSNGGLHLAPLHPLFCSSIDRLHLQVLFAASIVEVQPLDTGYTVQLITKAGLQTVRTRRILDTTSLCLSDRDSAPQPSEKAINALLHCGTPDPALPTTLYPPGSLQSGRFATEAYLHLPVHTAATWAEARTRIHEYWSHRPASWQHWTIATIADGFDIRPSLKRHTIAHNWHWLPSSSYAHVLLAYEAGLYYAENEER